ncbi:hypothetical protein WS70_17690 [Burkholderia mayonis]|uniref:DUF2827 domain-containing protein n=2 Tax=Burkholderia mayonis TaxID=1385591 RepID=A0A1B4FPQ5_9BURK|nr:hypothetical protein WS70_17690 [Burkholderia mayonis]KVE42597.1 hypothetical protein WS70_11760 [Burkholderia mayonis]
MQQLRIGISIDTRTQDIWQNGLYQNAVFLAAACLRLPFVDFVELIDVAPHAEATMLETSVAGELRIMPAREACHTVDVIIELSGVFERSWLELMRARGKKLVLYQARQPYAQLAEPPIFGRRGENRWGIQFDEIWMPGIVWDSAFAPMLRTAYRCDVFDVPFIWHPEFVDQRAERLRNHGLKYGSLADSGTVGHGVAARVAVFEPNASVVRSCIVPMLICDAAYRRDHTAVRHMHVLNTQHMKDHPTMLHFAASLDIVKDGAASFHGVHDVVSFMPQFADFVVAHEWRSAPNYTALDLLYGGYPLIHNAEWMRQAGYYYPDADIEEGARLVGRAVAHHAEFVDDYEFHSRSIFTAVDPLRQDNLDAYAERLKRLCASSRALGYR